VRSRVIKKHQLRAWDGSITALPETLTAFMQRYDLFFLSIYGEAFGVCVFEFRRQSRSVTEPRSIEFARCGIRRRDLRFVRRSVGCCNWLGGGMHRLARTRLRLLVLRIATRARQSHRDKYNRPLAPTHSVPFQTSTGRSSL
jgi:hypothetical protein